MDLGVQAPQTAQALTEGSGMGPLPSSQQCTDEYHSPGYSGPSLSPTGRYVVHYSPPYALASPTRNSAGTSAAGSTLVHEPTGPSHAVHDAQATTQVSLPSKESRDPANRACRVHVKRASRQFAASSEILDGATRNGLPPLRPSFTSEQSVFPFASMPKMRRRPMDSVETYSTPIRPALSSLRFQSKAGAPAAANTMAPKAPAEAKATKSIATK